MIFGFINCIIVYKTSTGVSMGGEWKVFFRKKDLDSYDIDFQSEWCCFKKIAKMHVGVSWLSLSTLSSDNCEFFVVELFNHVESRNFTSYFTVHYSIADLNFTTFSVLPSCQISRESLKCVDKSHCNELVETFSAKSFLI